MKKIILFSILILLAIGASAQRGRLKTLALDTLAGNNNQTLGTITLSGTYESLFITVAMDRISAAAGGALYLKSGVETASVLINNQSTDPSMGFAPNDTLTMSDVATQYWNITITDPTATKYIIYGDGDANDTVQITTKYYIK